MRKLFLQINVSLDRFIEDGDGQIDWHFADDEFEEFINDTLRSIDAMVFDRVAYEPWPSSGPRQASTRRRQRGRSAATPGATRRPRA